MKRNLYFSILIFLCLSIGCGQADDSIYSRVSMIKIITAPSNYYGKKIEVKGYLKSDINLHLYVDKDRAESGDYASAISIEDKSKKGQLVEKCEEKNVAISGVLVRGKVLSRLQEIEKIVVTADNSICWKKGGD